MTDGLTAWENRKIRRPKSVRSITDYPDHHVAVVGCRNCGNEMTAMYPNGVDPNRMECPSCGAKDSEIVEYIQRVWKQ